MQNKELIDKLNMLPEDGEIILEGCDCLNLCLDVKLDKDFFVDGRSSNQIILTTGDK